MPRLLSFPLLFYKAKAMFSVFCYPHVPLLTLTITLLVWKPSTTVLAEVLILPMFRLSSLIPESPFSNQSSYQLPSAVTLPHCFHCCFWHVLWTILSHYLPNVIVNYSKYFLSQQVRPLLFTLPCTLLLLFILPLSSFTEITFSSQGRHKCYYIKVSFHFIQHQFLSLLNCYCNYLNQHFSRFFIILPL